MKNFTNKLSFSNASSRVLISSAENSGPLSISYAANGLGIDWRNGLRVLSAICLAPVITFGLLMLMHSLIDSDLAEPEPVKKIIVGTIFDVPEEAPLPPKPEIQKPDDVELPPPVIREWIFEGGDEALIGPLDPTVKVDPGFDPSIFDSDSPVRLVAVAPDYPPPAITRGIEGYVDVRFDITKAGTTENIEIVAYDPSTIFNRAVVRAVSRWRYQPPMVKGDPVPTPGVMERVSFELEK